MSLMERAGLVLFPGPHKARDSDDPKDNHNDNPSDNSQHCLLLFSILAPATRWIPATTKGSNHYFHEVDQKTELR